MPKHDYHEMLIDLRCELFLIPLEVIEWAYDFRDLCVKYYREGFDKKMSLRRSFKSGLSPFGGDALDVKYVVRVVSKYVSGPHDSGNYDERLTVEVRSKFTNGFRSPEVLHWDRSMKRKKK